MNNIVTRMSVLGMIMCLFSLSACDITTNNDRPQGVPTTAIWVGGADGGVFVEIAAAAGVGLYQLSVYYENGESWYRGEARLKPDGAKLEMPVEESMLQGWDGETLFLRDGIRLEATSPP